MTIGKLTITFWRPRGRYQWSACVVAYAIAIAGVAVGALGEHPVKAVLGMALVAAGYRIFDRIEELPQ